MARTVEDLRVLFEVMQGPDDGDPGFAPVPLRWPDRKGLKKIRLGYFEDDGRTPVTPETRAAVRAAAEHVRAAGLGAELFLPNALEHARRLWWKLFGITGGMLLAPMTRGQEEKLSPVLAEFCSWVAAEPAHTSETLLDMWIQRDVDAWSYCEWFNLLGFPAAVVPVGKSAEGLPIGVQIVGRPWEEEMVLTIAAEIERACGGWHEPPA
jgi:Asp-tRNA(Asn)/Glu-tRNA(Gln) amidotransferase A subunit family amidase